MPPAVAKVKLFPPRHPILLSVPPSCLPVVNPNHLPLTAVHAAAASTERVVAASTWERRPRFLSRTRQQILSQ